MIRFEKEELKDLYEKHGSVRAIAKLFNIPKSTLDYYYKKYRIDVSKEPIRKEDVERLYKELGSVYKVAERLGRPPSSIYYYIDKYKINISKSRFPYSKEELLKLHDTYGSIVKVAAHLSKPYSTVRYWFQEVGIDLNESGMTIFQEIRNTPTDKVQKSAIVGSMLGDGGLWLAPHSKNARLYVCHCEKQLGYLNWLHDLLQPFSRPIVQTEKAGKKYIGNNLVNGSNFYRFYTIAHPDITELFHSYYREGLKHVDHTIIDKVDLLAMSIWFGDDGSIERNREGYPVSASIATNSFSYKEQLILIEAVKKFFNGTCSIKKQSGFYKGKKREDFHLQLSGKEHVQDFLNLIKLVLPECLYYKLS